jgi:ABC-2 type transport system ATP-binding protein
MQPGAIIEIKDFTFSYGKTTVFSDLSLTIANGTIHGILGPNGAGKSTLFNCIFEHNKYESISVKESHKKEFAYLQTEPYFYPYMTGMEYLNIVCLPEKRSDIELWNEIFQLPFDEYVHNYSTGMKKKIALLGNILLGKKILLLDEPTNGLDLEANEFFKLLVMQLKKSGITVIISSHVLETLFNTCDFVTMLSKPAITYNKTEFEQLNLLLQVDYGKKQQEKLDRLLPIAKTGNTY